MCGLRDHSLVVVFFYQFGQLCSKYLYKFSTICLQSQYLTFLHTRGKPADGLWESRHNTFRAVVFNFFFFKLIRFIIVLRLLLNRYFFENINMVPQFTRTRNYIHFFLVLIKPKALTYQSGSLNLFVHHRVGNLLHVLCEDTILLPTSWVIKSHVEFIILF